MTIVRRRKPWIAGLLSFLLPGLGHLYSGQAKRGLLVYGISLAIQVISLIAFINLPLPTFTIFLPFLVIISARMIFPTVDAIITTRRTTDTYQAKAYNRWYVYTLIFAAALIAEPGSLLATTLMGAFKVPTISMEDTVMNGDRIMVNKIAYYLHNPFTESVLIQTGTPRRGDIVVFKAPDEKNLFYDKRVIGLPGDKVEIQQGMVYVNDKLLSESYVKFYAGAKNSWRSNFGPIVVSPTHLFVLGDNRDNSVDSRIWGAIPQDSVISQVKKVYWSSDPQTGRIRWERIGKITQ